MPDLNNQPEIIQQQYNLQYDIITSLLNLDDDAITDADVREKVKSLKRLCMEIQSAPEEALSVSSIQEEQDIWGIIIQQLINIGWGAVEVWLRPPIGAALYNSSGSSIFVRTFDQRDTLRWIPYSTYTISPNTYAEVFARGPDNLQVDIRGRVFRCDRKAAYRYDGNGIMRRPY